jgi:hypothetical protein
VTLRLDRRLVRATVTVNGRHATVRLRHRRLVATVDFRGQETRSMLVRVRGTTRTGHHTATKRRYRVCG